MIEFENLKVEEKIFLMEELLNEFELNSPSWHKEILEKRKDYKNKKLYSIDEIRNEFSNKNN